MNVRLGLIRFAAAAALAAAIAEPALAEDVRIVVPYVGSLADSQDSRGLEDRGLISGLFFQWIDPARYQWNAFAYYAPDVNYAKIVGGHFIFDRFLAPDSLGPFLLGAGVEALSVRMDAGDSIPYSYGFKLDTTVLVPYARAGKYLKASLGPADASALLWGGIQPEFVTTEGSARFGSPFAPSVDLSSDDQRLYYIAGLNLRLVLFRFLDLEGKYQATFDKFRYYSTWGAIVNVFATRHWGLSYRYKLMEGSEGTETYHFFGVAFAF